MSVYYIDPQNGSPENDGLSPLRPLQSNRALAVRPGDTVLFRRGSVIHDALCNQNGEEGAPIRYGAYGDGDAPVFTGAVDVSRACDWQPVEGRENLWKCLGPLSTQVCNFVFDDRVGASLRWEVTDLIHNGDFWDSAFGTDCVEPSKHEVYLCCEDNPARFYHKIECVLRVHRHLIEGGHDFIVEDLCFEKNGVHGLGGRGGRNVTVRNCRFRFIGGCCWNRELRIRYGNGVEFWNVCENVTVERCVFDEIYDSGVTHQGSADAVRPAVRFVIRDNCFLRCGMGAYEQRDVQPLSAVFSHNVCMDAGRGFSHLRAALPRASEIWPEPMGHHVFLWRIAAPTPNARFEITDNVFLDAPWGGAIFSVCDPAVDASTLVDGNLYRMTARTLLNRFEGTVFHDFETYVRVTGKDARGIGIE